MRATTAVLGLALGSSLSVRWVTRRTAVGALATARVTAAARRMHAGCGTPSCVQCALRLPLVPGKHRAT